MAATKESQRLYEIGDWSKDGILQIVDTSWDYNGTMRVTIRETIGQRWEDYDAHVIERARRLAKRTLSGIKSTRRDRTFFAEGCSHIVFSVSRLKEL